MATKLNLTMEKGASFFKRLTWRNKARRPIDITGYSAVFEIRENSTSPVLLSGSTANGKVTLGGTTGVITINFSESDIAALPVSVAYRLTMTTPAGVKSVLVEGRIAVSQWG